MLSVMLLQRDSCLRLRSRVIEIRVLKIGSDQKEIWPVIQTCIITVVADIAGTANTRMRKFALYKQRSPFIDRVIASSR
jgi:hypothetical protein